MFSIKKVVVSLVLLNASLLVLADFQNPDGAGKKDAQQFITGLCTSDADCASGCCGFNSGLCAGPVIAQTRDGGCGHGDATPNDNAAKPFLDGGSDDDDDDDDSSDSTDSTDNSSSNSKDDSDSDGSDDDCSSHDDDSSDSDDDTLVGDDDDASQNPDGAGKKDGNQFITGLCTSDADCASGCCGFNSGLCAGAVIAQTRDGGCGNGDDKPNDNAAKKLQNKRYVPRHLLYGSS